jgi:hypothetical protein
LRAILILAPTALAGDSINIEVLYCLEAALFLAQSTLRAFILVNSGKLPAPELMLLLDSRLKQQMKGSGVYIAVN